MAGPPIRNQPWLTPPPPAGQSRVGQASTTDGLQTMTCVIGGQWKYGDGGQWKNGDGGQYTNGDGGQWKNGDGGHHTTGVCGGQSGVANWQVWLT
jgi:hypothetical protein